MGQADFARAEDHGVHRRIAIDYPVGERRERNAEGMGATFDSMMPTRGAGRLPFGKGAARHSVESESMRARNSSSVRAFTPSFLALASLLPASAPATR